MSFRNQSAGVSFALSLVFSTFSGQARAESCPEIERSTQASVRLRSLVLTPIEASKPEYDGLDEFSGLTIVPDSTCADEFSFWTIDDGQELLIRLSDSGEIIETISVSGTKDLETIAWDKAKARLAIISEQAGRVQVFARLDDGDFARTGEFTLSALPGYDASDPKDGSEHTLRQYYENYTQWEIEKAREKGEEPDPNSGWEGMTFTDDGRLYVVKEKKPAILIAVKLNEADLNESRITEIIMLNCGARKGRLFYANPGVGASFPFEDTVEVDGESEELDFSGLAYDAATKKLWMTSDQGQAVILFDPKSRTFTSFPLEAHGECLPSPERGGDLRRRKDTLHHQRSKAG